MADDAVQLLLEVRQGRRVDPHFGRHAVEDRAHRGVDGLGGPDRLVQRIPDLANGRERVRREIILEREAGKQVIDTPQHFRGLLLDDAARAEEHLPEIVLGESFQHPLLRGAGQGGIEGVEILGEFVPVPVECLGHGGPVPIGKLGLDFLDSLGGIVVYVASLPDLVGEFLHRIHQRFFHLFPYTLQGTADLHDAFLHLLKGKPAVLHASDCLYRGCRHLRQLTFTTPALISIWVPAFNAMDWSAFC